MSNLPIFITPTGALNVRSGPGIQHRVIGLVRPGDSLVVREPIRAALSKLGTYGEWIAIRTPRGQQGFAAAWFLELQTTDFILTPTGGRLRVREAPVSGRQIASVNIGDKLKALDPLDVVLDKLGVRGQWLQVLAPGGVRGWSAAWFLEWHTREQQSPDGDLVYTGEPWQFGRCLQGIHDRADRHPQPADFGIAAGRFEAVKVASGVTVEEVRGYRARFVLCRLFESWGGRALTVDDFLNAVIPDMTPLVQAGITHYEFHNEPNLTGEGLRAHGVNGSWKDGAEFARFFIEGRNRLRARFPQIQIGFPGLSPGGDTPYHYGHDSGFRMGHGRFLDGAAPALKQADFICVHTYYASWDELNGSTIDLVRKYRRRWPNKLLFVSEFGNGSGGLTGEEKGRQARHFFRLCNQIPGVGGAFYYIVSGGGWESWALRREDGSSAGIVEAML
jgi:hypothetical protein